MQAEVLLALAGVAGDVFVDDGRSFKVRALSLSLSFALFQSTQETDGWKDSISSACEVH